MTAIAAIVINDGVATPVAHTFAPVTATDRNGVAQWADRSGGIAVGFPVLTFSSRLPSKAAGPNRAYKVTAKVVLPVLDITSPSTGTGVQPAPSVGYSLIGTCEFSLPERSTLAQRKDLLAFVKNYLANAVVTAGVQDFETVY